MSLLTDENIGWNVLACADMILPMGSIGPSKTDMFPNRPWSYENNTGIDIVKIFIKFISISNVR